MYRCWSHSMPTTKTCESLCALAFCLCANSVLSLQQHKDSTDAESNLADECCRSLLCTPITHQLLILNTVRSRPYVHNLQLSDQQAYALQSKQGTVNLKARHPQTVCTTRKFLVVVINLVVIITVMINTIVTVVVIIFIVVMITIPQNMQNKRM